MYLALSSARVKSSFFLPLREENHLSYLCCENLTSNRKSMHLEWSLHAGKRKEVLMRGLDNIYIELIDPLPVN